MKTIAERAREYRNLFSESRAFVKSLAEVAYTEGATKQRAIDNAKLRKLKSAWEKESKINAEANYKQGYHDAIEMAFKWLKARNVLTDASLRGFRKSMEE